jgi:starch synthase
MKLNVLLVSLQVRGIDGTGGLGDVATGLSKTLRRRGDVDVRLILPGFAQISERGLDDRFNDRNLVLRGLRVPLGGETQSVDVFQIPVPRAAGEDAGSGADVPCYLLRCPAVFDGVDPLTGRVNKNSPDKAIFFCRAVVELLQAYPDFRPDVIHSNDWHSALIPVYLRTLYAQDQYLGRIATHYTTHNAGGGYQGAFLDPHALLWLAGLHEAGLFQMGQTKSLHHYDQLNFTKGALAFADGINTVSRQYREELLTPAFAGGLEGVFRERRDSFTGVVNGIDVGEWDPRTDAAIRPHGYSIEAGVEDVIDAKRRTRELLREWSAAQGPGAGTRPFAALQAGSTLIGIVSRIDYQKASFLVDSLARLCSLPDVQVAFVGNADPNDQLGRSYEAAIASLASRHPDRLLFFSGFNIPLSHLIFAASEMFLVPSAFEPCGLTQLVAMRYGSVPVARAVGGIVDTVIDEGHPVLWRQATGFLFKEPVVAPLETVEVQGAAEQLVAAVHRALRVRREDPSRWRTLIENGMRRDSSWQVPAAQYVKLYELAVRRCVEQRFFG